MISENSQPSSPINQKPISKPEKGEVSSKQQQIPLQISETEPFERRDATEEEIQTLRHVIDHLPFAVWIVAFAGAAERFTYYAVTAPWREFPSPSLNLQNETKT
jgi:hypothetical protein